MNQNIQDVFTWVNENAIVEVRDFDRMPAQSMFSLNHIHENGICKKNRNGLLCPVDNR